MKYSKLFTPIIMAILMSSCTQVATGEEAQQSNSIAQNNPLPNADAWGTKVSNAAKSIINKNVRYIPDYVNIPYPNGDVPPLTGVCTDVVIRTYRKLGIDLQQLVHEDMKGHRAKYPNTWGVNKIDANIDHRRVPNLMVFFKRNGTEKPMSSDARDYLPGDIVCWKLDNGMTHIWIVCDQVNKEKNRYQIVHNIGAGQIMEDCLFSFIIIGHYTYNK